MDTQKSHFNRYLLTVLAILFALTLAALIYPELAASQGNGQWWMALLNLLILSIPLILLYGSIYVLVIAWREHAARRQIKPRLARIIHWAPRIASIVIILFISLFSLDVFETQASPLELLGGLLLHNLPSLVLLVLLIFAWERPAVGFVAFLIFAVLFIAFFVRSLYAVPNLIVFVFPILLIAGLFYADWKWLKPPLPAPDAPGTHGIDPPI
jgi:hypothetical protein